MKEKILKILALVFLIKPLTADNHQNLEAAINEMNELHRTRDGGDDMIFNAISSSMVGWGIGLAAGIAVLTGFIYNSYGDSDTGNTPKN